MVYTPGNHVYRSTPTERSAQSDAENRLPRRLFIAVTVLGVATYGASFGPVADGGGGTGWSVRFAALAALCAAFSLLPRQSPQTFVTAALASMGFLDALSDVVLTAQAEWPLTVIAALNAVQAAAAIAALVFWRQAVAGTSESAGYDAYVDYYNQAVRQYYGQQAQASTPQTTAGARLRTGVTRGASSGDGEPRATHVPIRRLRRLPFAARPIRPVCRGAELPHSARAATRATGIRAGPGLRRPAGGTH